MLLEAGAGDGAQRFSLKGTQKMLQGVPWVHGHPLQYAAVVEKALSWLRQTEIWILTGPFLATEEMTLNNI